MLKRVLLLSAVGLFLFSCGKPTEKEKAENAQKNYAEGIALYRKGDYTGAAEYLRQAEAGMAYLTPEQIKNLKYKLALALYKDGKYEDAILELEDYITYYPSAENIEEAYLYLINAYLKISPDPWRDQTYTLKALKIAKEFLQKFPNSKYVPQIEELIDIAKRKLVKHYYLLAKFYEDYGYYYPAALRFEYLLLNYPNDINTQDVLYHYIKNLFLTPSYARKKEKSWKKRYKELKKKIDRKKVEDIKAAQKRLEFYKEQIDRWKKIAKEAIQMGEENLKVYKQKFGEDKYYKQLLKIKKEGKEEKSWIEKIL
jgi:outer membrane protein assembly factor BamD